MRPKILLVDDDTDILVFYQDYFERRYTLDTASAGSHALELIQTQGPYAVVVADMNMPEMDGIELLERCNRLAPDTVRIMLTGEADFRSAIEAINKGHIFQFLTKPCPPEMLSAAIDTGVKQHKLITAERELLEKTLSGTIKMLTEILSMVEAHSFDQAQRIRDHARIVAQSLKMDQLWELDAAAMLCQIGSVTIPASIVQKLRQNLTLQTNEKAILERVPQIGAKLLSHIPRLEEVARIILYQNKNFDGAGFPYDSANGDNIPLGSRILKVVSELARLESEGLARRAALEQMRGFPGRFDPQVLDAAAAALVVHASAGPKRHGKPVMLQELAVGQILAEKIETTDHVKIVGAGSKVSPMLLEKLQNFSQLGTIKEPIYIEE
ncbi:MAG: response regulator [Verrucomicrobia bacterium]|nr:response regulator [Verrucomicrobiota bacterium]